MPVTRKDRRSEPEGETVSSSSAVRVSSLMLSGGLHSFPHLISRGLQDEELQTVGESSH